MSTTKAIAVHNLTCEYARNPLGLQTDRPRFAWQTACATRGAGQAGYHILVASRPDLLVPGRSDLWDSGRVQSPRQTQVSYEGRPLRSRQRCWWTVCVADAGGRWSGWADPQIFELALLWPEDWDAEWLGHPAGWSGRALYVRCPLKVDRPLARARAYVAGLGVHEMRVNGRKLGDAVLDPATTAYARRVLYVVYDLDDVLRPGANTLGVILGNGWFGAPRLLAQVHLDYTDGTSAVVSTQRADGPSWQIASGPVLHHGLFDGETYDARLLDPDWDTPDYDRRTSGRVMRWTMASAVDAPGGVLVAQPQEPIRVVETLAPVRTTRPRPGAHVLDFGTNMAGWARLEARAPAGTTVTLRFAETLRESGEVNQDNLRGADACDRYTFAGHEAAEVYEPRFTYHGFRFVQVDGLQEAPTSSTLQAKVVRTAVERRGRFECDAEVLNGIYAMVVQTEASNLHGVPTDCPQRDERMGWLNDMTARAEQAVYNFELPRFYSKFVDDIADARDTATGEIPDTVPFRWGYRHADPVCIGFLQLPWLLYQHYGETRLMERHYPAMVAWVRRLVEQATDGILSFSRWGDWSEPSGRPTELASPVSQRTPGPLVSTAFLAEHLRLLGRIAAVLGRADDAARHGADARRVAASFDRHFWDEAQGCYATGSQACCALPLAFGLVPPDRVESVLRRLADDIEAHDGHLTTGNIATKYLLEVLSMHGRHDLACRVAMQRTYPSWGYMLDNGATTLWERWEHATGSGMNSHNHPMFGSVGAWLYRHVAGLRVADDAVACDRLVLAPRPTQALRRARAELPTPLGTAAVDWHQAACELVVHATVPSGSRAVLRLPLEDGRVVVRDGEEIIWPAGSDTPDGVLGVKPTGDVLEVGLTSGEYHLRATATSAPLSRAAT